MQGVHRGAIGALVLAVVLGLATGAAGNTLTLNLDFTFSGTPPAGATPWLVATFDDAADSIGAKGVRLTLSAAGLSAQECVTGWYFNFDPALNAAALLVTSVNTSAVGSVGIGTGTNALKADGDGWFDLLFSFPDSQAGRFTAGESVVLDIAYTAPISVDSFHFSSVQGGGNGTYHAAAHIQAIGCASQSGWIGGEDPVEMPEPASMALLAWGPGLLAVGLVLRRRRRVA